MNPEAWAYIHHLFFAEKLPKRLIARKLSMDIKTIRRALKKNTFSRGRATPRGSKLDPFKDPIQDLLKKYPGISGVRICQEIKKIGYAGGISILHDYLRTQRPAPKAFLHIQTLPAEEAQVDWAYAGTIPAGPTPHKVYCFLLVLSFSSLLYLEFFPSPSLENFLTGHLHAFHFLQGVPKKIRYDNLPSVVRSRLGATLQFNPRFFDFAKHYLFDPSVCNLNSPHEKGIVERHVRYVKKNLLAGRTFSSLTDLNHQGFLWRDQVANCRLHGTTRKRPIDLFQDQEQTLLLPLPAIDYDPRLLASVKSSSQGLIKFESNRYSVPFPYANQMLTLKANAQEVWIYDQEELVAQHRRCLQKYQLVEDPRHSQGLLKSRPKAADFKHRDLLLALGDDAQRYLAALSKTELHLTTQLQKIADLINLFGTAEVKAAIDQALAYQALGHDYLKNIILANRRKRAAPPPLGTPSSRINPDLVRSTWVEERNPKIYDDHFQPEEEPNDESGET
jgi:transposase